MLRILFYLMLGASPLWAQANFDDAPKVAPAKPPTVLPAQQPGNAVMQPGVTKPPPGTPPKPPERPAELPKQPVITELAISPGTVREGLTDPHVIRTTIKLSSPALKDMHCHVVSEDPKQMGCTNIIVPKGQQEADGLVTINWKKVLHNGQVQIQAYDEEHPETLFHARLYLRKKLE